MSQLKGFKIQYKTKHASPTKVVSWKQGSILGIGGNKSHTYKVYVYMLLPGDEEKNEIVLFVQEDHEDFKGEPPEEIEINNRFQFGFQNESVFLVLHDKTRKPYQYRFVENDNLPFKIAKNVNELAKNWAYGCDFSWAVGDYLRDFNTQNKST